MTKPLKAPFPWYGGKSRVAAIIWQRLGQIRNYIEPFAGSLAVLTRRPQPFEGVETINDKDCMVANFWRATQHNPEGVVAHADGPVNEADLHSRHRWLVLSEDAAAFRAKMRTDPDYFDAKVAGWWCWGLCCWIGGGWCTPHGETADGGRKQSGPQIAQVGKGVTKQGDLNQKRPRAHSMPGVDAGHELPQQIPDEMDDEESAEEELSQQMPRMGSRYGQPDLPGVLAPPASGLSPNRRPRGYGADGTVKENGVHSGRPQLADAYDVGRGVNSQGDIGTCEERRAWLLNWFGRLRDRFRLIRVCCGTWLRVCDSPSVTTRLGLTGLFLDPPYAKDCNRMHAWVRHIRDGGPEPDSSKKATNRSDSLYSTDWDDVDRLVAEVHLYCVERGAIPDYRIALAGYAGEHESLEQLGWECVEWKAQGGYGNRSEKGRANRERERLWFSPGCNPKPDPGLFDGMEP